MDFFFCLIQRQPRGSTLFPYTTLFRSTVREAAEHPRLGAFLRHILFEEIVPATDLPPDAAVAFAGTVIDRFRDRKSTRLNSSHVAISYAVFCLKKKKSSNS